MSPSELRLSVPLCFRVLVCGGRDFTDGKMLQMTLDGFLEKARVSVLIEGGARGADRMARDWAKLRGIPVETFGANWVRYGKRAGPIRNLGMLREGRPDIVIAFPGGKGTANMVEQARKAGVEVVAVKGWKA